MLEEQPMGTSAYIEIVFHHIGHLESSKAMTKKGGPHLCSLALNTVRPSTDTTSGEAVVPLQTTTT